MIVVRSQQILVLALIIALLFPATLHAQKADLLAGVDEAITQAKTLGDNHNYDGAIKILKRATERYPTNARVYLALANWQEMQGLFTRVADISTAARATMRHQLNQKPYADIARDMFETYGLATMYVNHMQDIRETVAQLTAEEYPSALGEYGVLALPGDPTPFSFTLSDPNLPTEQRGVYQGLMTTRPLPVTPHYTADSKYGANPAAYANDPKYRNWQFQNMLLAYAYDRDKHEWNLRFRVMWQEVPGQQEQRAHLAQSTAQLLLRDSALLHAYTGLTTPRFSTDGAVNVWLAEGGDAGGESYNDSIYLQQVGVERSATEWVREISHEYSHQSFPVVGGYAKPEWGANGYMGEKLFLRWLLENRRTQDDPLAWLNEIDAQDVKTTRIDALIRQFAAQGPDSPALHATDEQAMNGFIGMALYLELTRGGTLLASNLKAMTTPSYAGDGGFLTTLTDGDLLQQSLDHPSVLLHLSGMPADIPYWVYLRAGIWQGTLTHSDTNPLKVAFEVDGKAARGDDEGNFFTPQLTKGWHRIKMIFDGDAPPTLSTLRLLRR